MTAAAAASRPHVNPWLVAVVVALATFMEVLDTTIASVSLRHIAGNLGAGLDESTWVLTSYLVANAVVMPISGWLMTVIGRKRFFMICTGLFTLSSFLCGMASSLPGLIFFRILQGASGGGLQPCSQAILADTFPPHRHGQAFALYGIAVVVAPVVGPTLGGWITDNYSWHWIFLINVPVGLVSLFLTGGLVHDHQDQIEARNKHRRERLRVDTVGFILVAVGLAALELFLDEGERNDWLASEFIRTCGVLACSCLGGLVVWELRHPRPIVDIPLLRDRSFLAANIVMFAIGFILYGTTQLLPQLLQTVMGYTAMQAGLAMTPGGLAVMCMMPVVAMLLGKWRVQPRLLVGFGLTVLAMSLWNMRQFSTDITFPMAMRARVFQSLSFAFLFVPINTVAYAGLPAGKNNNASALINLMRNVGGSTGIAVCTAMLSQRSQFHQSRLVEHLTPYDFGARQYLEVARQMFAARGAPVGTDEAQALGSLAMQVRVQSTMLAYVDIFAFLTLVAVAMVLLVGFLRRTHGGPAAAAH